MNWNLRYAKDKEEGKKGFKPPAGVQSAARHALKLIEEGKAGDGFTSVGRGRAHQLANGETLSLETVKRMHSYFSRHRVDKKGKDWDNDSPGKVAWLAWGGDAGASWAASIVKKHGGGEKKESAKKEEKDHYQYIKKQGDKWVILQKGTGKVLSHHDTREKAIASFKAMMVSKHGSVVEAALSCLGCGRKKGSEEGKCSKQDGPECKAYQREKTRGNIDADN